MGIGNEILKRGNKVSIACSSHHFHSFLLFLRPTPLAYPFQVTIIYVLRVPTIKITVRSMVRAVNSFFVQFIMRKGVDLLTVVSIVLLTISLIHRMFVPRLYDL